MKNLYILGAGGFGKETAWLVERINAVSPQWSIQGFLDDNKAMHGQTVYGYPVLGDLATLSGIEEPWVACAIANSKARRHIVSGLSEYSHIQYATLIDPSVDCSRSVVIGKGCIICAHALFSVDVMLGDYCLINPDCTIGHDAVLKSYCTLYPSVNISGCVTVGPCTEIGTGSQIIQGKTVGAESVVGAGAVVVRDIPAGCTAVGCPARPLAK